MICKPCQKDKHGKCPGGTWCDCQHGKRRVRQPYGPVQAFGELQRLAVLMERLSATKPAGSLRT